MLCIARFAKAFYLGHIIWLLTLQSARVDVFCVEFLDAHTTFDVVSVCFQCPCYNTITCASGQQSAYQTNAVFGGRIILIRRRLVSCKEPNGRHRLGRNVHTV